MKRSFFLRFFLTMALLPALAHAQPQLSLFKPDGGNCVWYRMVPGMVPGTAPGGQPVPVARFKESCRPVSVSVSSDATRAVVWFHHESMAGTVGGPGYPPSRFHDRVPETAKDAIYQITIAAQKVTPLPLPKIGRLSEIWIAGKNLFAATLDEDPKLPSAEEGIPALARAFRLNEKLQWEIAETAATTTGWDYAQGVSTLKLVQESRASREMKDSDRRKTLDEPKDESKLVPQYLPALKKFLPPALAQSKEDSEAWFLYLDPSKSPRSLFVWQAVGEFAHDTGMIIFLKDKQLSFPEKLGYTASDLTSLAVRKGFLLITVAGNDTHPRLYDLTTGKLLFHADDVYGVSFWDELSERKAAS